jgi:two-component system, NtrC family, sensor kinase
VRWASNPLMAADLDGSHDSQPRTAGTPPRHSAAKLILPRSLRSRLPILTALVVAAVLTTATYAEVRSIGRVVELELVDNAQRTTRAVVDDLLARGPDFDPVDARDTLHELIEANAALRSISILEIEPSGTHLLASTSSEEREESLALAQQAVLAGAEQIERRPLSTAVALPLLRNGRQLAVVTAVSRAGVDQVQTRGRTVLLLFALPTILIVTLLMDVVMRRLIHQPIDELRKTIRRVAEGDLASRAPVLREDELGTVATGLNDMLERLDDASNVLQHRVREATSEPVVRNAELEESYQQALGLREALTRAERMAVVGQMAASVAHQVGTPLNLVSGYVQMIREDGNTDAGVRERLQIVETQLAQVTHVLRTMLDQARRPAPRVPIRLSDLVERACAIARPRLVKSGVRLDVSVSTSVGDVYADAAQLELALLALMTNALDAMPAGGTLAIRATPHGEGIRLEVADSGHGIPAELIPRLFDSWVTTKPAGHGTGLGLGIVRDVVHTHGGEIHVSNAPGSGAVFTIDLPAVESQMRSAEK